jgi:FixJ family two-component response regulator
MAAHVLSIAVVDDEESVRKALRRLFRSVGMQVETFASGQDFLNSLVNRLPDCLVLDFHMPGLTGLDVQRRLTSAGHRLPSIVITGHDQPGIAEELVEAGAAAYLTKPVDDQVLLETITKAVSRTKSSGAIEASDKFSEPD